MEWAQSSSINDPLYAVGPTDPHKRQWAIDQGRFPAAFGLTEGRALLGAVEQGVNAAHPDLSQNARQHYIASVNSYNDPITSNSTVGRFPQSWVVNPPPGTTVPVSGAPTLTFDLHNLAGHGVHVAGIMTAAKSNSQGGVGGCPGCGLALIRAYGDSIPLAFDTLLDTGVTAVNFSAVYGRIHFDQLASLAPMLDLINAITNYYDVAVVAAMGNDDQPTQMIAEPGRIYFYPFPAMLPNVIGAGGSDVRGWRWEELRIAAQPLADRHPLTDYSTSPKSNPVTIRCSSSLSERPQCASSYGIVNRPTLFTIGVLSLSDGKYGIDILAPAAQVLSTIDRTYSPFRCAATASGSDPCTNPNNSGNYPPNGRQIGNNGTPAYGAGSVPNPSYTNIPANAPLFGYDAYGSMTGTSMSAPYVTALVGLLRSINPLLSATEVKTAIKSTATAPSAPPGRGPYTENEVEAGTLHAENAVKLSLGRVNNLQVRNRLTPVMSLTSSDSDFAAVGAGSRAWLYTTSPQVAMAAIDGRLYQVDDPALMSAVQSTDSVGIQSYQMPLPASGANDFGVARFVGYEHSTVVGVGAPFPPTVYELPAPYLAIFRRLGVSFFIYATPYNPISAQANALRPLYRMSMKCNQLRKHYYTTDDTERANAASGPTSCGSSESMASQGYYFDGIEGYVFPTNTPLNQRPGTIGLYRKYHPGEKAFALVLETEESLPAYAAYTAGRTLLGFVYPAVSYASGSAAYVDTDGDGLGDAFEIALGTDPGKADTDLDGLNDHAEYPMAGLQPVGADPLSP